MDISLLGLLITVVGAVLGLVGVIYKIYYDMPHVRLKISLAIVKYPEGDVDSNAIVFSIDNNGKIPIIISFAGIMLDDKNIVIKNNFPATIQVWDKFAISRNYESMKNELKDKNIKYFYFQDSSGKKYKSKKIKKYFNN